MNREIVAIDTLSVIINGARILDNLSLSVSEGEFLGIVGPNGGGKTTLLKVILGLLQPVSGTVRIFGKSPRLARKRIGYVPQRLFFDRDFPVTVNDTVFMGRLSSRGLFARYGKEDSMMVEQALETVGMTGLKKHLVGELSGGEIQRMLIARALVGQPDLLLLDEPTASIDPEMKTTIYDLLDRLHTSMTLIMVSHDTGAISQHVSRTVCLSCGMVTHGPGDITREELSGMYRYPVNIVKHKHP